MTVLLGLPCPPMVSSDQVSRMKDWYFASPEAMDYRGFLLETTPNMIDRSIWNMITVAKEIEPRPDWWLRCDLDVSPELDLEEYVEIAEENLQTGFACSATPALSDSGVVMVGAEPPGDIHILHEQAKFQGAMYAGRPYAASWFSGSFVFTHRSVLDRMSPTGVYYSMRGKPLPRYFDVPSGHTEDSPFCARVRELGFRICVDGRIVTLHDKKAPRPSFRPPMKLNKEFFVPSMEE